MPNEAAVYTVIGVRAHGVVEWKKRGAPSDGWMLARGMNHKCAFVGRYFPSKKGWVLIDIRKAQNFGRPGHFVKWVGHVRLKTIYPTREAAEMVARHLITSQPVML